MKSITNEKTGLKKKRFIVTFSSLLALCLLFAGVFVLHPQQANAAIANWTPGRIIDDAIFTNKSALSVAQIQQFLNSKVPTCDTMGTQTSEFGGGTRLQWAQAHGYNAPFICLKDYSENGISSAQIIYNASQQYSINPEVLIVLLQKEQGLVTDTWPLTTQYTSATGYGCPDTAACDSQYYGLTNQINWSAKMFRAIMDNSSTWYTPKTIGNNYIQWNPSIPCGGSVVNIENRATQALYNYTPYQPNQAALNAGYGAGDSCSSYGNRNFYLYFTDWFGSTKLPTVFKVAGDPSIYVQSSGYKFYAPTISILNDFGLGSGAQTVDTNEANAIPLGSTAGMSGSLQNVITSPSINDGDGGAVYLVSAGKKYLFTTAQQMADYGYSSSDAVILPYTFISTIPDGGTLSNYTKTTASSVDVYQISSDSKRLILDSATLNRLNPSGSVSLINSTLSDQLNSESPLSDSPALVRTQLGSFYLYSNSTYSYIPTPETLACWNFSGIQVTSFQLTKDTDVAPIQPTGTLSCVVKSDATTAYILSGNQKIQIPSTFGLSSIPQSSSDISTLASRLTTRSTPLHQSVQEDGSYAVWYLESGQKKIIPTPSDLQLLGIAGSLIDRVPKGSLDYFTQTGIKFGNGQVVRSSDTGAIYVILSNTTKRYVSTPEDFSAYGYSQAALQTTSTQTLDQSYSTEAGTLSQYMYTNSGGIYLMDPYGCYGILPSDAAAFGIASTKTASGQTYDSTTLPYINLANCNYASIYLKSATDSGVYVVAGGQKHIFTSWSSLQNYSHQTSPRIITLSQKNINAIPTGSAV